MRRFFETHACSDLCRIPPYNLHPPPFTVQPQPSILHPQPFTLHPNPNPHYTLLPTPHTINLAPHAGQGRNAALFRDAHLLGPLPYPDAQAFSSPPGLAPRARQRILSHLAVPALTPAHRAFAAAVPQQYSRRDAGAPPQNWGFWHLVLNAGGFGLWGFWLLRRSRPRKRAPSPRLSARR